MFEAVLRNYPNILRLGKDMLSFCLKQAQSLFFSNGLTQEENAHVRASCKEGIPHGSALPRAFDHRQWPPNSAHRHRYSLFIIGDRITVLYARLPRRAKIYETAVKRCLNLSSLSNSNSRGDSFLNSQMFTTSRQQRKRRWPSALRRGSA